MIKKKEALIAFLVKQKALNVLKKIFNNEITRPIIADSRDLIEPLKNSDDLDEMGFYVDCRKSFKNLPKKVKPIIIVQESKQEIEDEGNVKKKDWKTTK